ncbi:MAG: M20/M25/M40 family metallo-hydrolase [Geminicoccaceae bacterium]|nr:M20/M25/M40 family metallo-hydrolase [Geminicoccaceae bacterium]
MPDDAALADRARDLALTLTSWPSVTGTADEAGFAGRLAGLVGAHPYFRDNPGDLIRLPVPGGPYGRENVVAVVRGRGRRAVLLAGHYDVVPVDDYGPLKDLAWHPERLRQGIVARLEAGGGHELALDDLRSGGFLPGRGLLDMKSGLAAGLAVLEAHAADPECLGSLVFLATPDEEDRSAGMRAAAEALPGLLAGRGLEVALGINLDAVSDQGDGASGRVVALGCIGKLLLSVLVVGVEAHACYPLDGVNAAHLAAELLAEVEFAPELGEEADGEAAVPPTALGARDLKTLYNVTTPGRAWLIWNVLTKARPASEVLAVAAGLALRATERARARIAERAARLQNPPPLTGAWARFGTWRFEEVRARARAADPGFDARFEALAADLAGQADLDLPTRCRTLTEAAWDASGLEGPAVVLGFASMPYPAVRLAGGDGLEARIRRATAEVAAATGTDIGVVRQLPVIVDMSFLGPIDAADLTAAAANTPVWGSSIDWDPARPGPGWPMVNVGPWGRDYHHWLERVHVPYAFGVLPRLVRAVALAALEG